MGTTQREAGKADAVTRRDDTLPGDEASTPVDMGPESSVPSALASRRVLRINSTLAGGRLQVLRRLGEGGMGVVYEAFDTQRQERVALKTLSQVDPRGIYQFKNEFRALTQIHHPNLVRLHHLFVENDIWFFTMDLIEGLRFDRWARPGRVLDEARLRSALRQLIEALAAIHEHGKLHRDVKSSNVLVTAAGQVLVLDLGLVTESFKGGAGQTVSEWVIAGTPEYMAPEQAFGQPPSSASDFYGVGVMLYEALTGHLPFEGRVSEILVAKQRQPELLPALLEHAAPRDLALLCVALLSKDPAQRPTAAAMLEGPCAGSSPSPAPSVPAPPRPHALLFGRDAELAELWTAYEQAAAGQPLMALVSGESGIGKTELCRAFLDDVRARRRPVVLAGRCYEREGVPFKALDPLIDELSRHFRKLSREDALVLLPRDAFALVKLFPVLGRVEVIAEAPERDVSDPYELQRRAFAAFAELLGRMRDRGPLIVHIDDAHWTDADSALFLRHLWVDRGLAPCLFVVSRRREAGGPLDQLLDAARSNPALCVRELEVQALGAQDAERLAQALLPSERAADAELCVSIARESRGSPFFVSELSRSALEAEGALSRPSVSAVISARVERLSLGARRLLEATALVGQPLSVRLALEATLAAHTDLDALLDAHLVRESESLGQELVECYHDRIRETVVASLSSAATREHYARLAPALARDPAQDPELVSRSWQGAGQRAEAARYAILAAERADLAMAFDHAAALYQTALELGAPPADETALIVRLGHALENGGRGTEAAAMYRRAAERLSGDASTELSRRAAEQLLVTGRVEEGTALLREVCSELDVFFPRSPGSALLSLAWSGLRVRARDLEAELPDERRVSEHDALRLRTARTVVTGLIGYLPAHVASVAGRYLLTALDKGDLTERVRSIGFNAYVYSHIDPKSPRSRELLRRMDELAEASGRAELRGFASLMKGTSAYHFDLCRDARHHFEAALSALRGSPGVTWEIDAACVYDQMSASYCGDHAEIARSTPALVDEALRRGRVWTGAMLSGFAGMPAWLAEGGGTSYRRQLAEVARHWRLGEEPRWPDYVLLMGEALVSIVEGQPQLGFELLDRRRATYVRYMLTRGAGKGSIGFATHHGRCAASALGTLGRGHPGRARWTRVLEQSIAALTKNSSTKAQGMAAMLDAALAVQRGDTERGVALLRRALGAFERAETRMFVAAARRRLGEMVGGDEGRELISRGDEVMSEQGVKDLDAETELNCPGFGRR